jgi:hypothetical protein
MRRVTRLGRGDSRRDRSPCEGDAEGGRLEESRSGKWSKDPDGEMSTTSSPDGDSGFGSGREFQSTLMYFLLPCGDMTDES